MTITARYPLPTLVAPSAVWTDETYGTAITTDGQVARLHDGNPVSGVTKPITFQAGHDMSATLDLEAAGDITPAVTAGYRVRAVRLWAAYRQFAYAWPGVVVGLTGQVNGVDLPPVSRFLAGQNYRDDVLAGDWLETFTGGAEWDATNLTDLALSLQLSNQDGTFTYPGYALLLSEAAIEVDTVQPPEVTALHPPSGYVDDYTALSWATAGNDPQTAYELKVWTAAVATGGGFDPETSPTVIDHLGLGATSYAALATANLPRGADYYWSVRVAKDFHGAPWWSDYATPAHVTYNDRPIVTVDGPPDPSATTSRPLVEWTSTDAQYGIAQAAWEVRIYREPLAGWPAGGQFPTAAPYTSAAGNNDAKSWRVDRQLESGQTYRAWVRVRGITTATSSGLWSLWSYTEFTNTTPAVAGPVFTGAYDGARVHLELTSDAGDPADFTYTIERSLDGGDTWAPFMAWGVLGGTAYLVNTVALPLTAPDLVVDFYDQDLVMSRPLRYRAFTIDTSSGFDIASDPTEVDLDAFGPVRHLYLADPSRLGQPITLNVDEEWLPGSTAAPGTVFRPIGSSVYVVQTGQAGGDTFTIPAQFTTEADYDAVVALLTSGATVELITERRNWWVRLAGDLPWQDHLTDSKWCVGRQVLKLAIPFAEVADPRIDFRTA